jgi:hypothetical protein
VSVNTVEISAALSLSRHLGILAEGMDAAATAFPGATSEWQGPAAELLGDLLNAQPARFRAIAVASSEAAAALSEHADRLGPVAWLRAQAAQSPPALADELERRATQLAEDSARVAAGTMLALARSAPPAPSRLSRVIGRFATWRGELALGAAQATQQLASSLLRGGLRVVAPYDPGNLERLGSLSAGLTEAAKHPVAVAKSVLDWDTWRSNPPRAIGHLLPNLAVALAGGGAVAGDQVAQTFRRGQLAVQTAAARDTMRREFLATSARDSRQILVGRAASAAGHPQAQPWLGEGGATLTAEQNASVEAFHTLSTLREPEITQTLSQAARQAQAQLAGLRYRLKEVDSLKRKLATQQARTGRPLPLLLIDVHDTLRYTVVFEDQWYTQGVTELTGRLERYGFHSQRIRNRWQSARYRGVNTRWLDPASGTAFEVQFHTPSSWRITEATHPIYEQSRLPDISPSRKAELERQMAEAYRAAPLPPGVERLTAENLPPGDAPDPIVPPVDHIGTATMLGAVGAAAVEVGVRPEERRRMRER